MNFNHDTGSIDTILNLDTSSLPPSGGTAGVLTVTGTGGITLPVGTTAQRGGAAGTIRLNSTTAIFEGNNGSSWIQFQPGTVTSVGASSNSIGLVVSGSPVTGSGTIALSLNSELRGVAAINTNGIIARTLDGGTGAATYTARSITGTANRVAVSNGDGVAGSPVIDLAMITNSGTGSFLKVATDSYGRVTGSTPVVASDITSLVDSTYVNITGDTMTGSLVFSGGATVTGLPLPVLGSDAASKSYVDSAVTGLAWKNAVKVASTANLTLATVIPGLVIDGVTLVAGDRVLLKNQTTSSENGIYTINSGSTPPSRSADADTGSELVGATVFVDQGTANASTGWTQTTDSPITLSTSPITFVQFSGAGTYSAGTGLTLVGNTFALSTPVATSLGGTGLTSVGSANTILGVNAAGSSFENKNFVSGTGINITHGVGNITVNNTGVTSVELSLPSMFTVSGSPVQTSGTLSATLVSQAAKTVLAAPTGASGIPTFRTLAVSDLPFQLYAENPTTVYAPSAVGGNSVAEGSGAVANNWGQKAFSNDRFANNGDSQQGTYVMRCITSNATAVPMKLDAAGTRSLIMPPNSVWTFSALIAARRADSTGGSAGYKIEGVVKRDATVGSIAFIGTSPRTIYGETNSSWNVTATVNTADGSLTFNALGEAGKTIRWVATVTTAEVA